MYDKKGDTINDSEVFKEINQQLSGGVGGGGRGGGVGELPSKL